MTLEDFKQVPVTSPAAGIPALGENRVDAVHCAVGMAQTAEVNSRVKVRYLPAGTDPAGIKRAQDVIPGASYPIWEPGPPGLLEPLHMLTFAQNIICNKNLPDAVVESLLNTWWDNMDKIRPLHPLLSRLTSPKMLFEPKAGMPYHSGAVKFYKKKGIWDAKQDVYQKRILNNEKPFLD